jgi:EAL domain-containing protein (putative c-di-GMP-specific phosphodiesterase class I)
LAPRLTTIMPDLVLIVVSGGQTSVGPVLELLAAESFRGKVILLGARSVPELAQAQRRGERLGLAMLPVLTTPFQTKELIATLSGLLPARARSMPVDVVEALANDWLELRYQPRVDPRSLTLCGAEAVIQLRHPTWGIVVPDRFVAVDGDPHFGALTEFVLAKATADSRYFVAGNMPIEVSVALPAAVLGDPDLVDRVRWCLAEHPAFGRLTVGVDGAELAGDLGHARETARKLSRHNIGVSISNVNGEWGSPTGFDGFPFVEIKIDGAFVQGSSRDRLKRAACTTILDVCRRLGVRAAAGGVDTRADFLAVREAGFDLVQGPLFGKPMNVRKFARTLRTATVGLPP